MPMQQYEFRVFPADPDGNLEVSKEFVLIENRKNDSSARSRATSLVRDYKGPVDLAYAGYELWEERYITTASPSEHHASRVAFERIKW